MNPEELIKNLLINNTYNIEAQCGTRYDALNVSMEEMAKLIVKSLSDHSLMSSIISESEANGVSLLQEMYDEHGDKVLGFSNLHTRVYNFLLKQRNER